MTPSISTPFSCISTRVFLCQSTRSLSTSPPTSSSTKHSPKPSLLTNSSIPHIPFPRVSRRRKYSTSKSYQEQRTNVKSEKEHPNIIIHEIPNTALISDVMKQLRERRILTDDHPVKITPPPPSYPRRFHTTRSWHLSFPSSGKASFILKRIRSSRLPLFPYSITTFSNPSQGRVTDRPFSHHLAQFTPRDPEAWTGFMVMRDTERDVPGYTSRKIIVDGEEWFEWGKRASGRRIVLRGLPGEISISRIEKLVEGCKLDKSEKENIKRLPLTPRSKYSTFCLTMDSVSEAWLLARKLHLRYYQPLKQGDRCLVRAEVC
ncbi:hypothetical protein TREMEDRAFT_41245 [Tremella mesenterica DSM 1558]|uniref:uncharacterized protein n=1 Tax=Tremella mesenterica (strain ATCC 24925 / CBS 8224 / DSM 1558 / NBRC 9311 / NRRL Y-6157 / RJB 2259-6 / UBC 559-6) TaxID=578456 RepID=UPI00032D409A|nr:uncharacterized protein TREMEDRAFT_41245 [Tremella mesenterica DSM 1558]EIW65797.1 hypothetical protein TREMEDRAFT_41245 [Tremella mesenterica DSM 1558]